MALRTNYIQYIQAVLTLQLPGVDAGTAAKERKQQRHHEAAAAIIIIAENVAVAAGGSRSCVGCFGRIGCGCWCCSLVQQYALLDNSA